MKKLLFVSNYNNTHQNFLAAEFMKIYGEGYKFIATEPFNKNRIGVGNYDMNYDPYMFRAYESPEARNEAQKMIDEAQCVMIGGIRNGMNFPFVKNRIAQNKITFLFTERILKGPLWKDIVRYFKYVIMIRGGGELNAKDSKFFVLCASAFAPSDYKQFGIHGDRFYKFGYFPEVKYNLTAQKEKNTILWAGRFIGWKHPELVVTLAKNLKAKNIPFHIKLIGDGEIHEQISNMVNSLNLNDCVELVGTLPNSQVFTEMQKSQIFLFTSDRGEGWGAVLNEAMSSQCAVVASEKIGSVPYLINHGHNGLIFRECDADDLTEKVLYLLNNPAKITEFGNAAYRTMTEEWCPAVAAKRFVELSEALNAGRSGNIFADGPLSPASVIKNNWFRKN